MTYYTNALLKTWKAYYDAVGNLTGVADPLQHRTQFEYSTDGLNNLLSITPPGAAPLSLNPDKTVTLQYNDPLHPTSPTKIIQPAALPGETTAETLLEYYGSGTLDPINSYGKLKKVTPPYTFNPVVTEFDYDRYGQPSYEHEGQPRGTMLDTIIAVGITYGYRPDGLLGDTDNGITKGGIGYDANGNPISFGCGASPVLTTGSNEQPCFPGGGGPVGATGAPPANCTFNIYARDDRTPNNTGCTGPNGITWNPAGELTQLPKCAPDGVIGGIYGHPQTTRIHDMTYDELGRLRSASITSDEATADSSVGPLFTRSFTYNPDWGQGRFTRVGPDGTATEVWLDAAGRVQTFVRRDAVGNQIMSALVDYDFGDRGDGGGLRKRHADAVRVRRRQPGDDDPARAQ